MSLRIRRNPSHPRYEVPLCAICWTRFGKSEVGNYDIASRVYATTTPITPKYSPSHSVGDTFSTRYLGMAGLLVMAGHRIEAVEMNKGIATFHFNLPSAQYETLQEKFLRGEMREDPLAFWKAMGLVKSILNRERKAEQMATPRGSEYY